MSKGHTIPLLHLAHLLLRRSIVITVFTTPANYPFIADFLSNTTASIIVLPFPQNNPEIPSGVESTDKLSSMSLFHLFSLATKHMQPDFERKLETLRSSVNFIAFDGFLWWVAESAMKFGIPKLLFLGSNNYSSCLLKAVLEDGLLSRPELDNDELMTVRQFPWIKVNRNDFDPLFTGAELKGPPLEHLSKVNIAHSLCDGFITNSFYQLESILVDYWNTRNKQKSWCVGPLCLAKKLQKIERDEPFYKKPSWIRWLDLKLNEGSSVLYAAFGSQAEISQEQLNEIANGLEESKVNFLWVIRKKESELGEGFLERVKERGIIVRDWVDQMEILMHKSVKGFLSHCGWNSVLESLCAGVPILAWPMMAEQHLNARMVVEEIKVGLRVETCNGSVRGFVKKEGLTKMVKELMEGEKGAEVREKMKEVSNMANKAMEEGTGSSWRTLDNLIEEICSSKQDSQIVIN
ncbi:hypothetical protein JCGZ_09621 [Jatropha curcas]|uniref:Glycosyltransferase n=2 Tax=Jatropha curcas TaxID=180498 RepID=A0A067LAF0_JATCU|nr:hypothetical protein JCGZ_09621 [Jatropha curcas]